MNIYFFKFPLEDSLGGGEFYILMLAKYFQGQGQQIKLITSDAKLLELFRKNSLPAEDFFAGWEPTSKWSLLLWPLTYLIATLNFRGLLQQIPHDSILIMQSLTEKLLLTPLARQCKTIWLEHKIPGRWLKLNPLLSKYQKLAAGTTLVTVSKFAKREFVHLGMPESKISVIYPGVGVRIPVQSPPVGGEKKEKVRVGILGRFDPEKGVFDFLKIILPQLLKHPHWQILVAGEGREQEKIAGLAATYPQIKPLGFVKNLDEFFSQISILVYPSKVPESFGLAAAEAMAYGKPVIASELGALPEIIRHEHNGFLVKNGEDWAAYLEKLQDKNLYHQMSQAALASARNFTETQMFRAFKQLI